MFESMNSNGTKNKYDNSSYRRYINGLSTGWNRLSFFPDQSIEQIPSPKPMPKTLDQIFSAIFWIGIAASISIIIVGGIFLINQIKGFKLRKANWNL